MGSSEVKTCNYPKRNVQKQTPPPKDVTVCRLLGNANEVMIELGGKDCLALIDTGSMISSVSEQFYKAHLEPSYPMTNIKTDIQVQGAGGNDLNFLGVAEMELRCSKQSGKPLLVPMFIMPDTPYNTSTPAIIGTNVLAMLKEEPNLPRAFSDSVAVLNQTNQNLVGDINLYASGYITLPPKQVTVISARVGANCKIKYGVPSAVENIPGGVTIPQSMVRLNDKSHKTTMCLVNITDHDINIPKLQKIAVVQPARVIEVPLQSSDDHSDKTLNQITTDPDATSTSEKKGSPVNLKEANLTKTDQNSTSDNSDERGIPVNLDDTDLTQDEKSEVYELLQRYSDVFAFTKSELGTAKGVKHSIRLTDSQPFKDRPRRLPPAYYKEVKEHIEEMLACGAIRRSNSPWCSNIVLARKQDGSLRICLDFRKINSRTIQDAYHIPRIEETLDRLAGAKWFSCLDLQSGYWQVEMAEDDKVKTAFCIGSSFAGNLGNLFECNRMPFGLTNAPATFQRLMESSLGDLPFCQVYLDDIIIFSGTFREHLDRLEQTLLRIKETGLKLKPSKCHLFRRKVKYLGHVISEEGVETDPEKIQAIQEWPLPETVQDLRRTLGFFGYYRRFIKNYSSLARPLHDLLVGHENTSRLNKKTPITMDESAKKAFNILKEKLCQPPILGYADYSLPFELHTDASLEGLGAVLCQHQNGQPRVIAYASRGLKSSEKHYPTHKLEFLALKWAVCDKFRDYLYGQQFEVVTDNNPLSYVLTTAKLDATGHRWLAELSTYNFSVRYRSGRLNIDADALSRIPHENVQIICNNLQATKLDTVSDFICYSLQAPDLTLSKTGDQLTTADWNRIQHEDDALNILHDCVLKQQKPSKTNFAKYPDLRIYTRDWEKLILKDGVLFRKTTSPTGEERTQLVIPRSKKDMALKGLHDDLGHMGRDRTTELAKQRFFWPHLADDVKQWINACEPCIKRKVKVPDCAELVNIKTTQPMELVCTAF